MRGAFLKNSPASASVCHLRPRLAVSDNLVDAVPHCQRSLIIEAPQSTVRFRSSNFWSSTYAPKTGSFSSTSSAFILHIFIYRYQPPAIV